MTDPRVRVAVKMQPSMDSDASESFRATLPMGVLFEQSLDSAQMEHERIALEEKYRALVVELRALRVAMKTGAVLRYWEFGDAITRFEQTQGLLFVEPLTQHLVRDVRFSERMIQLCRRFREKIPRAAQVDSQFSFTRYYKFDFDLARIQPRQRA